MQILGSSLLLDRHDREAKILPHLLSWILFVIIIVVRLEVELEDKAPRVAYEGV